MNPFVVVADNDVTYYPAYPVHLQHQAGQRRVEILYWFQNIIIPKPRRWA